MINTLHLHMSIATMEGEIVDVNVRLKQTVRQRHRQVYLWRPG